MSVNKEHLIKQELDEVHTAYKSLPGVTEISCVPVMVQYKIHKTKHKELTLCMQFPDNYPHEPLLIELKTKVLAYRLITGLSTITEEEVKKYLGKKQVLVVLRFVHQFIEDHPLCVCSEEINRIKHELTSESDKVILKQKTSQLVIKLKEAEYYISAKLTVPNLYPDEMLKVEVTEHNFPEILQRNFVTQANELARRCVQPPLKKKPKSAPFEPLPSLYPVVEYLTTSVIRKYPHEICPVCREIALPADPKHMIHDPTHDSFVERVYCTHLYHHGCLNTYMKTPPFTGGKKCPSCGNRIYHEKWKETPQVAEARWAHKEARARELGEVVDFLE